MSEIVMIEMLAKLNFIIDTFESGGIEFKVGNIPITDNDYIDECDACVYLKVEKRFLYERRIEGELAYIKHMRKIWYRIKDIRDYNYYYSTSSENKPYTIKSTNTEPIFGYERKDYIKIYRPKSSFRFLYGGEMPEYYCFGLEQLPH